jgi:hypothetical protein
MISKRKKIPHLQMQNRRFGAHIPLSKENSIHYRAMDGWTLNILLPPAHVLFVTE